MTCDHRQIAEKLGSWGEALYQVHPVGVEFTGNERADRLLNDLEYHPHAFVFGCLMDRQIKAERAWLIPFQLAERLGGFEFTRLQRLNKAAVRRLLTKPAPLHRFGDTMARNLSAAIVLITNRYGGDASRIWSGGPSSAEVVYRFLEFPGIGPKIATMATRILAQDFKISMSDYYSIDVSVDVHVRRVFTRLGLVEPECSIESIIYRARALNPEFPGLLDYPCWEIGRTWCKPRAPLCSNCPMRSLCPTAKGTGQDQAALR